MHYFFLHPDVHLEVGAVGGALYDLARRRIRPLDETEARVLAAAAGKQRIEHLVDGDGAARRTLERIAEEGLGRFFDDPVRVDPYVWATASSAPTGLFQRPLVIRAVLVQLGAHCNVGCSGCGELPLRCGCNTCARWPAVPQDARLGERRLTQFYEECQGLTIRRVVLSGGDLLREPRLRPTVGALRDLSSKPSISIVTPAATLSQALPPWLADEDISLTLAANSVTTEELSVAVVRCRKAGVRVHVALTEPGSVDRATAERLVAPQGKVVTAQRILPVNQAARELSSWRPLTLDRLTSPAGSQLSERQQRSSCLDGIVALGADGVVRPCPMIPTPLGKEAGEGLRAVLRSGAQNAFWALTKKAVAGCRHCEYWLGCRECAAMDLLRPEHPELAAALCRYDPTTGSWLE